MLLPNIFWFSVFPFDPFVVSFALLSLAFVVFCRGYTCLRMIYKQRNLFSFVLASILSNVPRKLFEFYSTCHRVKIKSKAQRQRCEIPNANTEFSKPLLLLLPLYRIALYIYSSLRYASLRLLTSHRFASINFVYILIVVSTIIVANVLKRVKNFLF